MKGIKRIQTSSCEVTKSWGIMYSTGNRVNNIIIVFYGDRGPPSYHSGHFVMIKYQITAS